MRPRALWLIGMLVLAATPAGATPGGSISGRVTDNFGVAIDNLCVRAYREGVSRQVRSDVGGRYTITGLSPGSYTVDFVHCPDGAQPSSGRIYISEIYEGTRDPDRATPVVLSTGVSAVTGIDATLNRSAQLSGRVDDSAGRPAVNVCVHAYNIAVSGWGGVGKTRSDGRYLFDGMFSGPHRVEFQDCGAGSLLSEWYRDAAREEDALPVELAEDDITVGIDATLDIGGTIAGRVTSPFQGPTEGIAVFVLPVDPASENGAAAYAARDGTYRISGLRPDRYRVRFGRVGEGGYAPEWYEQQQDASRARVFHVGSGSTYTNINATLGMGGRIVGRVTDVNGWPIEGICVGLAEGPDGFVASGYTDHNGLYELQGLSSGSYRILFNVCRPTRHSGVWYGGGDGYDDAAPIAVKAGSVVAGIDAVLTAQASGCPSGPDTDADGLSDCDEIMFGTDVLDPDTDDDLYTDGAELRGDDCIGSPLARVSNPLDPASTPVGWLPRPIVTRGAQPLC